MSSRKPKPVLQTRVSEEKKQRVDAAAKEYGFPTTASYLAWLTDVLPRPVPEDSQVAAEHRVFRKVCECLDMREEEVVAMLRRAFVRADEKGELTFPLELGKKESGLRAAEDPLDWKKE